MVEHRKHIYPSNPLAVFELLTRDTCWKWKDDRAAQVQSFFPPSPNWTLKQTNKHARFLFSLLVFQLRPSLLSTRCTKSIKLLCCDVCALWWVSMLSYWKAVTHTPPSNPSFSLFFSSGMFWEASTPFLPRLFSSDKLNLSLTLSSQLTFDPDFQVSCFGETHTCEVAWVWQESLNRVFVFMTDIFEGFLR